MSLSKHYVHTLFVYIGIAVALFFIFFGSLFYKKVYDSSNSKVKENTVAHQAGNIISEQTSAYDINVAYPVVPSSLSGAVLINAGIQSSYEKMVLDFKNNATQAHAELPPALQNGKSSYIVDSTVVATSVRYVSLRVDSETFLVGMAHPMHTIDVVVFDIQQEKLISSKEMFLAGSKYLTVLSQLANAEFKSRDGNDLKEGLKYSEIFKEGMLPSDANFSLLLPTHKGIVVYFQEYQVAPYVYGPQQVTIPYSELGEVIDPKGILGEYLK